MNEIILQFISVFTFLSVLLQSETIAAMLLRHSVILTTRPFCQLSMSMSFVLVLIADDADCLNS